MAYNELDVRYSSGQLRVLELFAPTFEKYPLEEKTYAGNFLFHEKKTSKFL